LRLSRRVVEQANQIRPAVIVKRELAIVDDDVIAAKAWSGFDPIRPETRGLVSPEGGIG
jgi:hypothetical protein